MKARSRIRLLFFLLFSICVCVDGRADFPVDTPLMEAAREGEMSRIRELVEAGADVNETRGDGENALMAAARSGHEEVLRYLIKKGAEVDGTHSYGWTALNLAAGAGRLACVKALIEAGASLRKGDPVVAAALEPLLDETPDSERIQRAVEVVGLLAEAGADVDAPHRGDAPLMMAARMGSRLMTKRLVEVGADVNRVREENLSGFSIGKGWTALHFAAGENHVAIALDLLKAGVRQEHVDDVLALASGLGRDEIARALIAAGANPDSRNKESESALKLAAHGGRETIVGLLIDAGADPGGKGVLVSGAFSGNLQVVRRLVEAGADLRGEGREAAGMAVRDGHAAVAAELIKAGVDPDYRDQKGNTILMRYIQGGYINQIHLLKTAGVDIDARNHRGETALITAVKMGKADVVWNCLHSGADVRVTDASGKTALDHAVEKGRRPIIDMLAPRYKKPAPAQKRPLTDGGPGNPVKNEILGLSVEDDSDGPRADRDRLGEVWIFGKQISGREVYIKLKIAEIDSEKIAKCISFHAAEHPLHYPFK